MLTKEICRVCLKKSIDKFCLDCIEILHDNIRIKIEDKKIGDHYNTLIYCSNYEDVKTQFEAMKYFHEFEILDLFINLISKNLHLNKNSLFTYIPSTRKNRIIRGYDFSKEICIRFSKKYRIPLLKIFKNNFLWTESKKLNRSERLKYSNQKLKLMEIKPKEFDIDVIYVIDDLITTGSTLNQAAKLLKSKFENCAIIPICIAKTELT